MFALQAAVPIVSKPASANALLVSPSVAAGPSGPASWPPSDEEESHSGTTSCASSSIATSTSSLNATPTSGNYDTPSLMNAGDGTKRHVPAPALAIAAATATATTSPTCTAPNPVATASLAAAALAQRVVYADSSYWDGRYAHRPVVHFDWFFSYKALRNLLQHAITQPTLPVLHVGCGNSDLSNGLAEDGIPVVNTDISPVVINQMRDHAATWPEGPLRSNCSFEVADCRAMPQYDDGVFGTVLDKGTLDAVLCSGTGLRDARCYVSETHRLLAPGGVFLLISLGQPETRLGVLRALPRRRRPSSADAGSVPAPFWGAAPWTGADGGGEAATLSARMAAHMAAAAETAVASAVAANVGRREVRWQRVLVYLLPKPSLYLHNEASLLGRAQAPAGSSDAAAPAPAPRTVGKDEPVSWLGPFEVGPALEEALKAPGVDPRDYFYAYACIKPGTGALPRSRRGSALVCDPAAPPMARLPSSGLGDLVISSRSRSRRSSSLMCGDPGFPLEAAMSPAAARSRSACNMANGDAQGVAFPEGRLVGPLGGSGGRPRRSSVMTICDGPLVSIPSVGSADALCAPLARAASVGRAVSGSLPALGHSASFGGMLGAPKGSGDSPRVLILD